MADVINVCCMCGDIGFPDKLFQCVRCIFRYQHSYCSNYYHDDSSTDPAAGLCDWCRREEHTLQRHTAAGAREKVARQSNERDDGSSGGGSRGRSSGASSSVASAAKHAGRRYKLLKDVLC